MNPMERADHAPEEFAATSPSSRNAMQKADAPVYYAHPRTGLLARFQLRMADRIDPTGEARKSLR